MVDVTLCFLVRDNQILLAMKKRGFGKGRWNGYGGKPITGEDLEDTAVREMREESGVVIDKNTLEKVTEIDFFFSKKPEWDQRVHTYFVREWKGEPLETEEMKPQWFNVNEIPYDSMWPEDKLWIPSILRREKLRGRIVFRDLEGNAETVELAKAEF